MPTSTHQYSGFLCLGRRNWTGSEDSDRNREEVRGRKKGGSGLELGGRLEPGGPRSGDQDLCGEHLFCVQAAAVDLVVTGRVGFLSIIRFLSFANFDTTCSWFLL